MAGKRGNNEGSIRLRSDGRWEARVTLPTGEQRSLYGKTRQEVAAKLTAALRAKDTGLPVIGERLTVKGWLTSWLEQVQPTVKPQTFRRYEQLVRVHLVPDLGRLPLSKLGAHHLSTRWAKMLASGSAPRTVHHTHTVLHKALEDALRLGLVARNVCDLVDPPRAPQAEMHILTPEQVHTLLAAAEGDRLEALYVVALSTGMRAGEIMALKWSAVDLARGTLQVRATLQYTRGAGYTFAEPKTKRSRRQIALPAIAVDALRAHRARQLEERLHMGEVWEEMDLVFPNTIGRPLDGTNLLRMQFYPLLKRAGLPRVRLHDLRHTAATLLLGQSINPKIVSELLGHASVAITLDLYSHCLPDMQQQAAAAMDAVLTR